MLLQSHIGLVVRHLFRIYTAILASVVRLGACDERQEDRYKEQPPTNAATLPVACSGDYDSGDTDVPALRAPTAPAPRVSTRYETWPAIDGCTLETGVVVVVDIAFFLIYGITCCS